MTGSKCGNTFEKIFRGGQKKILLVWSELLGDFFWGSIFVLVSLIDAAPISKSLKETVCIGEPFVQFSSKNAETEVAVDLSQNFIMHRV